VVLAIVGLILGSMLFTLSAQVDQSNRAETLRRLDSAKELLLAFAIVNGRLPCPARSAATAAPVTVPGDEVRDAAGACIGDAVTDNYGGSSAGVTLGLLPARALGFQPVDGQGFAVDAWGNRIRYAVSAKIWTWPTAPPPTNRFTSQHVPGGLNRWDISIAPDDLIVYNQVLPQPPACLATIQVTNLNTVAAIVFSTGKNGALVPQSANEAENVDSDAVFVSRPPDPAGACGGEFDDLLAWIPAGMLYSKLISAGLLP
jgi:type II secretory pathway pseudopilin PulG